MANLATMNDHDFHTQLSNNDAMRNYYNQLLDPAVLYRPSPMPTPSKRRSKQYKKNFVPISTQRPNTPPDYKPPTLSLKTAKEISGKNLYKFCTLHVLHKSLIHTNIKMFFQKFILVPRIRG